MEKNRENSLVLSNMGFLYRTFLNNRILDYLISIGIFVLGVLLVFIIKKAVLARLKYWAKRTESLLDDCCIRIFEKTLSPLLYFGAFYIGLKNLHLNPLFHKIVRTLGTALLAIFGILLFVEITDYILRTHWLKAEKNTARERSLKGVITIIKVVIWGLGIVFLLDNMGFRVSTVMTGLGIGGVAVALAAQAILGDVFSYFAILFDRPFEIGDFITVDNLMGNVEGIGIKTTKVRSLDGEQLIFANSDLTKSRIKNYKRMENRRVIFKIGVAYETNVQKLKEIPAIIAGIIKNTDGTTFDRVHFSNYGDFNLVFEIVYYIKGQDYNKYMDIQQKINFAIKEEFEKRGIEFAYPTQTVYVNKAG